MLTDKHFEALPPLLKEATSHFSTPREKYIFLLSALGTLSACFPTVSGIYHKQKVNPNLYVLILGPPGSDKSVTMYSLHLVSEIHKSLKTQVQKDETKSKAFSPKGLSIPGNASAAAVYAWLQSNNEQGLIFESEADSLANSFKQEWGGFSDLLRKAFQHENASILRKTEKQFLEFERPQISLVLSGTLNQLSNLVASVQDGLFSRFLIYRIFQNPKWRPMQNSDLVDFKLLFNQYAQRVLHLHTSLIEAQVNFSFTVSQSTFFDNTCTKWLSQIVEKNDDDAAALVYRAGLQWFRVAMILSIIRSEDNTQNLKILQPTQADFTLAGEIVAISLFSSAELYSELANNMPSAKLNGSTTFQLALPKDEKFSRTTAMQIGEKLGLKTRSVDEYLKQLCKAGHLVKLGWGTYSNVKSTDVN